MPFSSETVKNFSSSEVNSPEFYSCARLRPMRLSSRRISSGQLPFGFVPARRGFCFGSSAITSSISSSQLSPRAHPRPAPVDSMSAIQRPSGSSFGTTVAIAAMWDLTTVLSQMSRHLLCIAAIFSAASIPDNFGTSNASASVGENEPEMMVAVRTA